MSATPHRRGSSYRLGGLQLTDHHFQVPLDHSGPDGEQLALFAREVSRRGGEDLPFLVFFQGGPGFEATRPMEHAGWIKRALEGHRVLLLDQRGTGRSSAVDAEILAGFGSPGAQAERLALYRADNIVRDAEAIRLALLEPEANWSVLGQSFGGFCVATYLSFAPEHLDAAYITGGLPPMGAGADAVYTATFKTLATKNAALFERFPDDSEILNRIADFCRTAEVQLPCGDPLTVRRLQSIGIKLGMSDGPAVIHWLLERAFTPKGSLTTAFLRGIENLNGFDTNPLYAAIHETCYGEGPRLEWAAFRALQARPEFSDAAGELLLLGEMVFPWTFVEYDALVPFAAVADSLASRSNWPALYDPAALARNEVSCAAAVYADDLFVDRELSLATAKKIRGCHTWTTNEYEHNGLRADGERVLGRLIELARS